MASGVGDGDGGIVMEEEDTAESSGDAIFIKTTGRDLAFYSGLGEVGEFTLQTEDLREARRDRAIRVGEVLGG